VLASESSRSQRAGEEEEEKEIRSTSTLKLGGVISSLLYFLVYHIVFSSSS
jgi:hypothetical protein